MLFLSYQRNSSADLARYIYETLVENDCDVFFDVESINAGRFASIIEREIINRDYFLVILNPETLKSDWVRQEITTALTHRKAIIPLMTQGFTFAAQLPDELKGLADYSGIIYDYKQPENAITRILKAVHTSKPSAQNNTLATPTDLKVDYKWGVGGSSAISEFRLKSHHQIHYKREDRFLWQQINLYVDGELLLSKDNFNPIATLIHDFRIENIECQFICRFLVVGIDVKVLVGGHEVMHV